jgi:NhaA family Na+:H+ antiporter
MALFFLIMGLELKRELLVGELSSPRQALLPIMAAIGGMLIPALCYFALNTSGTGAKGWGIPMATDIAFAIGALSLLGPRIPKNLITFLIALAIVDDLGAVAVIALFYTESIDLQALAWAFACTLGLVFLNLGGVRRSMPYAFVGILLWVFMLASGIHATIAGILVAFVIPIRPKFEHERHHQQDAGGRRRQPGHHSQHPLPLTGVVTGGWRSAGASPRATSGTHTAPARGLPGYPHLRPGQCGYPD